MNGDVSATAASSGPALATGPVRPPRRAARWLLTGLLVVLTLMVLATTLIVLGLLDGAREGLTFVVDGEPWRLSSAGDWDIDGGTVLGAALAALVIVTVLAVAVPLVLLMALLGVALTVGLALLAAAVGLAVGLAALLLVLALALSPLWALALLLWWLWRRARPAVPADTGAV